MAQRGQGAPRSAAAQTYRQWYGLARWKRRRAEQLKAEPFCRMCRAAGVYTAATVADHVEPHKGDARLFWQGPLQSLCGPHHDSDKQREEKRAAANARPLAVDADGWPVGR